jgi:hypothetical protein
LHDLKDRGEGQDGQKGTSMTEGLEERFASHEVFVGFLAGRLEGLSGTTRYDLTDGDREALKAAANVLYGIAKRKLGA